MNTPFVDILPHVPLFAGLPDDVLREVSLQAAVRDYSAGASVFRQSRPCEGLHVVLNGAVKVYRATGDGRQQILYVEQPKHVFGESALFNRGRWPASASALEPSAVLFLPLEPLRALVRSQPDVAGHLMEAMARHIDGLICRLDKITLRDLDGRVAIQIMEETISQGGCRTGCSVRLAHTQEHLAHELGATRESLARSLRHLREAGAIDQDGARVVIRDWNRLVEFAGGQSSLPPCASGGLCGGQTVPLR